MKSISRRDFVKTATVSAIGAAVLRGAPQLMADPLGLPLGLQLYSVRDLLPKDYEGTLRQLAQIGYQEVEAAGYFGHSAKEVKQAMKNAGLDCVSAHYSMDDLHPKLDDAIAFCKEAGVQYIVCSSPMEKDPAQKKTSEFFARMQALTLDDWRWNAEQFNHIGELVNAAGMHFGYHNHRAEFHEFQGTRPYDELLRLTDPKKVTFEMDCGWVVVGGADPVAYLKAHGDRISMLHVKDFKLSKSGGEPISVELGHGGDIDYRPIFAAAKGHIKHYFVEQENFDMPAMQALKIDADYLHNLKV